MFQFLPSWPSRLPITVTFPGDCVLCDSLEEKSQTRLRDQLSLSFVSILRDETHSFDLNSIIHFLGDSELLLRYSNGRTDY